MKLRIACQDCQTGQSYVKCLSERHNRLARIVLNHVHYNHGAFNHSTTLLTFTATNILF